MRNTADVTGGKPIAVLLQSISGVSAINPLVAFYDIQWRKERGAILLFCPGHHTRLYVQIISIKIYFLILFNSKYRTFLSVSLGVLNYLKAHNY
jgi:hypothetical protein